jgi:hypothetical protein
MRVCVLPFIAALAIPAFAAPVHNRTPDSSSSYAHTAVFQSTTHSMLAVTPSTAADLDRLAGVLAPRTIAFWTVIDLEMLTLSERIEASPLLREGLASADDLTVVLTLN